MTLCGCCLHGAVALFVQRRFTRNRLTSLHEDVWKLPNLQALVLDGNPLDASGKEVAPQCVDKPVSKEEVPYCAQRKLTAKYVLR